MDLRYSLRAYRLNKALSKGPLSIREFYTLCATHALKDRPGIRFVDIHVALLHYRITKSETFTRKYLGRLITKEFITRSLNNYIVATTGIVALQNIEKALRTSKNDKSI